MNKAAILVRVSSKEQADNHSLSAQEDKLQEYCTSKGFKKVTVFRIVESSTKGERKEFNKMLKWIKEQDQMVYLVVDAVDRLQRSFKETVLLTDMMKAKQVELHFLKENLVLNEEANPMHYMMWNFAVMCAQNFVLSSAYNIKRSNERKLRNGQYIRKAPVGYRNYRDQADRSNIDVDEDRGYLVREAFDLYATGNYSINKLWRHLKIKKLTITKKETSSLIGRSSVHAMLRNRFYIGIMDVKGKEYPHNYTKLIDEYTFKRVQEVLKAQKQSNKKEETKHSYIFKGILKNKATGRLMSGSTVKGNVYYRSPKYGDSPSSQNVKEEVVLSQIERLFKDLVIPDDILKIQRERLQSVNQAKNVYKNGLTEKLKKEYLAVDQKLSNLLDAMIADRITQDEYTKKAYELKQLKKDLELDLKRLDDADEKFVETVQYLLNLCSRAYELFESSNVEQKRRLISFVLSNLELDRDILHYEVNKPFDAILKSSRSSDWYPRQDSNL